VQVCVRVKDNGLMCQILHTDTTGLNSKIISNLNKKKKMVGAEGWQEKVHNREERKKLLRTARNRRILHVPVELNNLNTVSNTVTVSCESERLVAYVAHVGVRTFIHSRRQSENKWSWPINIMCVLLH